MSSDQSPLALLPHPAFRQGSRVRLLAGVAIVSLASAIGAAHVFTARGLDAVRESLAPATAEKLQNAARLGLLVDVLGAIFVAVALAFLAREARAHARAERRAAEKRALLEAILDSMSEGVSVVDADGRIVLVNAARKGAHPAGFANIPRGGWARAFPFFQPDGRTPVAEEDLPMSRALRGESGSVELVRRPADGRHVHERTTFQPLRIPGQAKPAGAVVVVRDVTERRENDRVRQEYVVSLQNALADVKTLRGILPICANCKKIRNDQGAWTQVEAYVQQHTSAEFSHGICPECIRTLYPEFADESGSGTPRAPGA
jgi:PAS domain-containing protein